MTPKDLRHRIDRAVDQLGTFVTNHSDDKLHSLWGDWKQGLEDLRHRTTKNPSIPIALVGGTGAGKSTLVNALIGARVLPVSTTKACTSAVTEVSFHDSHYRATIEFVQREDWKREMDALLADLRDARRDDDFLVNDEGTNFVSSAALEKLWTVYRPDEAAPKESFDPFSLQEHPEITKLLDSGKKEIASDRLDTFRKEIDLFLNAKHRFWPIVKRVSIQGPFDNLRDGIRFVDLPGLNDPNAAREQVTKDYLKDCRFVWIVFDIKRALTKDTVSIIQSEDFLRQIIMDGRADALTFVATSSDNIDIDAAIDQFQLSEESEPHEAIAARNEAARIGVLDQLAQIANEFVTLARESQETATRLTGQLTRSKVFAVSAKEYLRILGLSKDRSITLIEQDQTEIPQLIQHANCIGEKYGIRAHTDNLLRQFEALVSGIKRDIQSQQAILRNQAQVTEQQREEMRAAAATARTFLERDLADARQRLADDLEASQALLTERVNRAIERAHFDLEKQTFVRWSSLHHYTILAVCRRGGTYRSAAGKHDFNGDLSRPILDGIAFAWTDFFGERLRSIVEKSASVLHHLSADYRRELFAKLDATAGLPEGLADHLAGIFDTTEKIVNEILAQIRMEMDAKILSEQRTLYERIPERIEENMMEAYNDAGLQRGTGMKQRMIDTLLEHARRVALVMFDDARDSLLNGVRSLNSWITGEGDNMTQAVHRNALLAAESLVAGKSKLTEDLLRKQEETLAAVERLAEGLLVKTVSET